MSDGLCVQASGAPSGDSEARAAHPAAPVPAIHAPTVTIRARTVTPTPGTDCDHGAVTEILHAWALAPAAIGTCCLAADWRRVRVPELAASLVMMIAMLDAAFWRVVPVVVWAGTLLVAAMALAAVRSSRRASAVVHSPSERGMTLHSTLGLVVMAALLIGMGHSSSASPHPHGLSAGALGGLLLAGAIAYATASVVAASRTSAWQDRGQYAAMGTAALLMGLAALG